MYVPHRREKANIEPYFAKDKDNLGQEHMSARNMYCGCAELLVISHGVSCLIENTAIDRKQLKISM